MTRFLLALLLLTVGTATLRARGDEGPEVRLPGSATVYAPVHLQRGASFSKSSAALGAFFDAHPTWEMHYNTLTGNPHRAWGEGISIDGYTRVDERNAHAAGMSFIRAHADLLRADPAKLRLLSSVPVNGKIYQKYVQVHEGIDVLNSYIELRIAGNGKVFMFGSDYHPSISVSVLPTVSKAAAAANATAGLAQPPASDRISDGTLFVLPLEYGTRIDYRLVYRFIVDASPEELWDTYVDAHNGSILWRRNLVNNLHGEPGGPVRATANTITGTVSVSIFKDSYVKGATTVPLPNAFVWVGGKQYITDKDGRYTADIGTELTAPLVARLAGPYAVARRADSSSSIRNARISVTAPTGQDYNILWDDANSAASERNVFYHMTAFRNYFRALDTSATLSDLDRQLQGIVNVNQTCNAFWDPAKTTLNFFKAGGSGAQRCGNTGEIADVVYHEFGHGIQQFMYTKIRRSGISNQALGEAMSDIVAMMIRDDPRLGIGFFVDGPNEGTLRNADNNYVYPKDIFPEYHDNGQILTGAVWDMRKAIGLDITRTLTHFTLYGTPDATTDGEAFADYFIEILVADDDDANLANGTPNSAGIIPAFLKHGIPGSGLRLEHEALRDQKNVTDPYPIGGTIYVGASINRNLLKINTVDLVYTTDGWGSSSRIPMTVNDQTRTFSGLLPAQRAGTIVRYYFEGRDNYGSVVSVPLNAPAEDFMMLVGYETKFYNDAEVTDGWTVEAECETGKWLRAAPIGTFNSALGTPPDAPWVQPNEDHTIGVDKLRCWVTGNAPAGSELGENDVDNGSNDLISRKYDVSAMSNPVLRYYRWYSNDQGMNPNIDAWYVRISSDGGTTWKFLEDTHEADAAWRAKIFRLKDHVDLTADLMVKFSAADSVTDKPSLVEAAVDDFEILDIDPSLVGVEDNTMPLAFGLEQNYPNPFNPATTVTFSIPAEARAAVRVYSPLGTLVATLFDSVAPAGRHRVAFDGSRLASGTYTCVFESEGRIRTMFMTLMK
ncbi:MAG: hypothetical protein HY962_03960 [Ignavibacteriae bacterium]|nr:hypothetical protein [Ignavibacteriota bacterium]